MEIKDSSIIYIFNFLYDHLSTVKISDILCIYSNYLVVQTIKFINLNFVNKMYKTNLLKIIFSCDKFGNVAKMPENNSSIHPVGRNV